MIASNSYAIVGLGVTAQGKLPGRTDIELKSDALARAIADAGLKNADVDGLIFQPGMTDMAVYGHSGETMKSLGLSPNFVWSIQTGGCSAIAAITMACGAIECGQATSVGIVYGDSALSQSILPGQAGQKGAGGGDDSDFDSHGVYGMYSPGADHALAAQRHMNLFGTTKEQLGEIAVSTRLYANAREEACFHDKTLTLEKYLETPALAEPLNRHDYCMIADGGTAFIVTSADRARHLKQTPVYVSGLGASLSQEVVYERTQYENIGCTRAGNQTFGMAGVTNDDIDLAQLYDCFTITVLMALEGYGFCPKGEGGPFVEDGNLRLGGKLPTNTAGGELAWSYQQGFTPVVEAIRQLRWDGGPTQVPGAERCFVSGHGGITGMLGHMDYAEASMILSRAA